MIILLVLSLVCLIGFSAFLSASETAMFSLSSFSLKSYKYNPDTKRRLIFHLLQSPRELLVTLMMLNVFANILVQNTVSSIFGDFSGWALKVGLPLFLTLFFGEIIPKSIALPNNTQISYRVAPIVSRIQIILGPIRRGLTKLTSFVSRIMFFFFKKEKEITGHELEHILNTSGKKGIIHQSEIELIKGYLDLKESIVKEHVRPRDEILFYNIKDSLKELHRLLVEEECSRVPVCDQDLENIIGIISIRSFFFHSDQIQKPEDLKKIMEKPFFVPASMSAWGLLEKLREKKENLAIAVDEYGSISGLITQEDLIESVVGEISDRRDTKGHYTRSGEDVIIASGKLELSEFEDVFEHELLSENNVVTIGGWLTEQLDEIPQAGTKYVTDEFLFYVLAADPNRVRRVYIRRLQPKKKDG